MTFKKMLENRIGKVGQSRKSLPSNWKRHFARMKNLPKPEKDLSPQQIIELVSD